MGKKRSVALLLALLFLVTVFIGGCGQKPTTGEADKSAEKVTENAPTASSIVRSGELTIWSMMTAKDRAAAFQGLADAYMKEYPDVKINIEIMPWAGTLDKLVAASMAGNPPDLSTMGTGWTQTLAGADALVEVSPLIKSSGGESAFIKSMLTLGKYKDGYYGMPLYVAPLMFVYRKSALQEAGFTSFPKTWDEYYNMCVKMTDKSKNRYGFGIVIGGPQGVNHVWAFLQSNNVNLVNVDKDGKWFVDVDPAAHARLAETYAFLYKLLRDASPEGILTYTHDVLRELFSKEVILQRLDNLDLLNDVKSRGRADIAADMAYAPAPTKLQSATGNAGANMGVFKKGNTELAQDFLKWIYEGDRMVSFYLGNPHGIFPVKTEMYKSAAYRAGLPAELKDWPDMAPQVFSNSTFSLFANGPFPFVGEVETQKIMTKPLVEMFNNKISAEQAADMLIKDLQALLR